MAAYFSYAEQSAHYFRRPHLRPAERPVGGPAAWRHADVADPALWRRALGPAEQDELRRATESALATGRPPGAWSAADFPLPTLSRAVAEWRRELEAGRGFAVVSGLPVAGWSEEEAGACFWGLGLHLGRPGAQNPQGDLLGHVRDTGEDAADPFVRLYRTRSEIAFHCDAADAVGLLCLAAAAEGGASRIASSVAVHDEILRRRPELAARLYEPFALDVRNEDRSGALRHIPVPPCRFDGERLRTFYHSDYFRSAQRHDDVPELTADERELLDLFESLAGDPAFRLDMQLAPGDVQWLSNHSIVHARTAYTDAGDAGGRHLLRLWLSLQGSRAERAAGSGPPPRPAR